MVPQLAASLAALLVLALSPLSLRGVGIKYWVTQCWQIDREVATTAIDSTLGQKVQQFSIALKFITCLLFRLLYLSYFARNNFHTLIRGGCGSWSRYLLSSSSSPSPLPFYLFSLLFSYAPATLHSKRLTF